MHFFDRKFLHPKSVPATSYVTCSKISGTFFDVKSAEFPNFDTQMSRFKVITVVAAALLLVTVAEARPRRRPPAVRPPSGEPMAFVLDNGDTVFVDEIDPVWCFPKGYRPPRGKNWRKHYKLVYNFNKVYPYALVARKYIAQVDSTIKADATKRSERSRYISDVEKELFKLFEKDIRNVTISQGLILMRLLDRECGMCVYDIIKTYENGFTAGFWQMVAILFSQNLKTRYDPAGKDSEIEELVKIWESGRWNTLYYSIFMEMPPKTVIKSERLHSIVRH